MIVGSANNDILPESRLVEESIWATGLKKSVTEITIFEDISEKKRLHNNN